MVKEKRIKSLLFGLFLFLISLTNVKADTVVVPVEYITNNTNLYISNNKGTDFQLNSSIENNVNIDIKNINLDINYNFKGNVIYQVEFSTPTQNLINVNKVDILSGDNACNFNGLLDTGNGFPKIRFSCPYDTNFVVIGLSNSSSNNITSSYNFRWNYTYLSVVNENVVNFDPVLNGQDSINNNINNMGEEIKDSIKDEFNTCRDSVNLYNPDEAYIIGALNQDIALNYYYDLKVGETYTFSTPHPWTSINVYDSNNNQIRNYGGIENSYKQSVTIQNGDSYLILVFNAGNNTNISTYDFTGVQFQKGSVATEYEPYGKEYCSNKIDETNDKLDETNNQLGDLNNNLTDSSPTDMSGLGDSAGWLPAGPVDSILTLPLTMLNSLVSNLTNNSCQTISVELPFVKENITLPCVRSLYDKMGVTGTIFTTAGLIASAFILFNYLLALYKWVDDTLTMRENTMPGYFDDNWGGGA